jgi:hypothetical protein
MYFSDHDRRLVNELLASRVRRDQVSGHRRLMEADPVNFRADLIQIEKCGRPWPCRRSACPRCGAGVKTSRTRVVTDRFESGKPYSRLNPVRWASPNTFIREKGAWMAHPFLCLPWAETSPCRVTWSILDAEDDPVSSFRAFRAYLNSALRELFPCGIMRGYGEIACVHANARYSTLPEHLVGKKIWNSGFADQPGYLLHSNLNIHHPGDDIHEAERKLRYAFPGTDRVWIKPFKEAMYDDEGRQSGGIEGWGEYSGFECKDLNFSAPVSSCDPDGTYDQHMPHSNDNASVARVRMLMLQKFTRPMRNLKYRDDEASIADAIRSSWTPGSALYESIDVSDEFVGTSDQQDPPRDDQIRVLAVHVDFAEFLVSRLLHGSTLVVSTASGPSWSQIRIPIVKRSRCTERENRLKSRPRSFQLKGFCQRPGIDKPP